MTIINARIFKSGSSVPVDGYIQVTAASQRSQGNNFFVTEPVKYPLVAGLVSFDLAPSDIDLISYRFDVYQIDLTEGDQKLYGFDAVVPNSATAINFADLANQSGIRHDLRDSSLLTLARYLSQQPAFIDFFVNQCFKPSGEWSATTPYPKNSVVTRAGSSYIKKGGGFSTNQPPETNPTVWSLLVSKGDTGAAGGTPTGGAILWNTATATPSGWSVLADSPITGDRWFIIKN